MTEMARRIVLAARPQGEPKPADFRLEEYTRAEPGSGEVLVEVCWLSLDPYMRGRMDDSKSYAKPVAIGQVMEGGGVGRVLSSRHEKFSTGDMVVGQLGWQSHAVVEGTGLRRVDPSLAPVSTALGILGMPGLTAYVGLKDIGQPKRGETLVVSAATGAVGSLVGQLGKIYGLRVVGVAGGSEKCAYATDELGFDACIDHRSAANASELRAALRKECPDGVDIYFENVGGKTLLAVMPLMNVHGRIPVCGMIGWYSGVPDAEDTSGPALARLWRTILVNRLRVTGYIITDHVDRYGDFAGEVSRYLRENKLVYRESVAEGLESAPEAFIGLLKGKNFGKQLVAVNPDPTRT